MTASLQHPLLEACGVAHGFGVRDAPAPPDVVRPRQVHGTAVARPTPGGACAPAEADAIASHAPGLAVAVVTADCVPILAAARDGRAVAAIHAGWRGLAEGVVEAGIEALRALAPGTLVAAIGPAIGACCYEVDAPVLDALGARFGGPALSAACTTTRPGRARVDLAALVRVDLVRRGLSEAAIGGFEGACTRCDATRFHSYRRDGPRSGRLLHHVAARAQA
ncbi:MAG: polyphenol oxidase family protein [Proteobacteria bacterium]|nr:polyphenol oxidase family protein [Pseudomonadota bacterium]